jgi:EAL domain
LVPFFTPRGGIGPSYEFARRVREYPRTRLRTGDSRARREPGGTQGHGRPRTEYSPLAALLQFPVVALKIDRSFVTSLIGHGGRSEPIVRGAIALAHGLGLRAIAEGIEHPIELECLRALPASAAISRDAVRSACGAGSELTQRGNQSRVPFYGCPECGWATVASLPNAAQAHEVGVPGCAGKLEAIEDWLLPSDEPEHSALRRETAHRPRSAAPSSV